MAADSRVEVVLYQRPDKTGWLRLKLWSQVKPRLHSFRDLELDRVSSKQEAARAMEITGGALAEYQCEKYGDVHDPSACAKAAREAFEELWDELEQKFGDKARDGRLDPYFVG